MLTTAPYFVCVYNKDYIYIIYLDQQPAKTHGKSKKLIMDKIKNMEKHMEQMIAKGSIR